MMKLLKFAGMLAILGLACSSVRSEEKPDYAKLIVGKWEVSKAAPGTIPEGAVIEFGKDGKLTASFKKGDKTDTIEGTYTLDGDKIKTKIGGQERETITIVKISESDLNTKDKDGKEVVLKRKK